MITLLSPVNLPQLAAELTAAGVAHRSLGTIGDQLHTYDEAGVPVDLPAGAVAVVAAHTPPAVPPTIEERLEAAEGALLALMGV